MEATAATLERRVRVIPATRKPEELHRDHDGKMRVAAYCRVSTDSEEQLNSYEAQKTYYTPSVVGGVMVLWNFSAADFLPQIAHAASKMA